MQTSISDVTEYRTACALAAADDAAFATFRRMAAYTAVVEPGPLAPESDWPAIDPAEYVRAVEGLDTYRPLLDSFRLNDRIGDPPTASYGTLGAFNRYTLRYIKILGDLERLFGSLAGLRILEIGGGYGGQCAIISRRFAFESYDIVDLPEALRLSARYLGALGIERIGFHSDFPPAEGAYDLLISNFALSELSDELRQAYYDRVIPRARRGYLYWNKLLIDMHLGKSVEAATGDLTQDMKHLFSRIVAPRIANELLLEQDRAKVCSMIVWGD